MPERHQVDHPQVAGSDGLAASRALDLSGMEYLELVQSGEDSSASDRGPDGLVSILEIEDGRAVFTGFPGEEHYNPIGMVHGGYAATILDSALGCRVQTTLPRGVAYSSLGLEVKYLRPITRETGQIRLRSRSPVPRPAAGDRPGTSHLR